MLKHFDNVYLKAWEYHEKEKMASPVFQIPLNTIVVWELNTFVEKRFFSSIEKCTCRQLNVGVGFNYRLEKVLTDSHIWASSVTRSNILPILYLYEKKYEIKIS